MATANYPPNDKARREKTRDKGQCQRCGKKVGLPSQYRVRIINGKVHRDKGAKPDQSHYCSDCADKRVKEKERYLAAGGGESTGKRGRPKKATAKKTASRKRGAHTTKAKAKTTGRKRTVSKAKPKAKAKKRSKATAADPF